MSEKKYTILISAVACILVVVLTLCSCLSSYAQSFNDVSDADWKYVVAGNVQNLELNKGLQDTASKPFPANRPMDFVDVTRGKYSENVSYVNDQSDYFIGSNITLSSDSEIVLVIDFTHVYPGYQKGTLNVFVLSDSTVYFAKKGYWFDDDVWSYYSTEGNCKEDLTTYKYSDSDYYYVSLLSVWTSSSSSALEYAFMTGKMKVFSTADDAMNYLETGDTSNMAWQGGTPKQTYNSELAFTSFDMSVHDSNSFDDYYLEFIYKCPDSWLGKNPKLVINQTWDYNIYYFNNKGTSQPYSVDGSNTCTLTVSGNNNSVKIPLGQLDCLKKVVSDNFLGQSSAMKRRILGASFSMNNGHYFTFNGLPIMADGSCKVDKSLLSLSCVVYVDGVAGHEYVGSVDLISGDNSMSTYTPDTSGNYTYNDDYRKNGHYYTDVSKDAAGNTTYNYYYYGTDGSKKDVSANDAANNTVSNTIQEGAIQNNNNPTFTNNNNITVEGDTINNDVNNYVGNNTSSETNKNFIEKFLGFFQLLENNSFLGVWGKVFGWLPPGISSVITTALGIGACVGLFKFFRK
mgnify:FL=1